MNTTTTGPTRPPKPRLSGWTNLTPFRVFQCDKMGPGRRYYDVLVVKGTFGLVAGVMEPVAEQSRVVLSDEVFDDEQPTRSSVKRAGDLVVTKPSTDVLVTGAARTFGDRPAHEWDVAVTVLDGRDPVLHHALRASGPRTWHHRSLLGFCLSDPEPASQAPIRYELSYGGSHLDRHHTPQPGKPQRRILHAANPSGSGHWDERALDRKATYPGPQWQDAERPVTSLLQQDARLAGLGPVARWWESRLKHAGTYDAAWIAQTRADAESGIAADYASDFDTRFFQCAHPKLISPRHLRGDESIHLTGLRSQANVFATRLPGVTVGVDLLDSSGRWEEHRLPLDTVHVDLDASTVALTWRMTVFQGFDVRRAVIHSEVLR